MRPHINLFRLPNVGMEFFIESFESLMTDNNEDHQRIHHIMSLFGEGFSFKEIADIYQITTARAHQLCDKGRLIVIHRAFRAARIYYYAG